MMTEVKIKPPTLTFLTNIKIEEQQPSEVRTMMIIETGVVIKAMIKRRMWQRWRRSKCICVFGNRTLNLTNKKIKLIKQLQ